MYRYLCFMIFFLTFWRAYCVLYGSIKLIRIRIYNPCSTLDVKNLVHMQVLASMEHFQPQDFGLPPFTSQE